MAITAALVLPNSAQLADTVTGLTLSNGQLPSPGVPALAITSGTLTAGTPFYCITATDAVGETLASTETSITIGDNSGVVVTWNAVPGASGYKVYVGDTGAEQLLAFVGVGTTTFTHNSDITPSEALPVANTTAHLSGSLTAGSKTYQVQARQLFGPNIACDEVAITVGASSSVSLTWDAVPGAFQYDVFGRSTGVNKLISTVYGTSFVDDGTIVAGSDTPSAANNTRATAILNPAQSNPVVLTLSNSGATDVLVTSVNPFASSLLNQFVFQNSMTQNSLPLAFGLPPFGPGQNVTIPAGGDLVMQWPVTALGPQTLQGGIAFFGYYGIAATIYLNNGSVINTLDQNNITLLTVQGVV